MSTTGDEKWRGNRSGTDSNRQNNPQRQSSNPRDRVAPQDRQNNRSPAMPRPKDMQHPSGAKSDKSSKNGPAPLLATDEHVPVNGFNAREVRAELQHSAGPRPLAYKPPKQDPATTRPANTPWATKSNAMANGKDFFLELRKQVSAAQRTGGTKLGG